MHVKMQGDVDYHVVQGALTEMATTAKNASIKIQYANSQINGQDWYKRNSARIASAFNSNYTVTTTSSSTNTAVYYDPATTTDQWVYVYNDPPQAQKYPAKRAWDTAKRSPVRRSSPKEFNKYINGSDLLEEFIAFLGSEGVRQGEVMALPLELFIKWLIIRAAEVDQEEPPVTLELPPPKRQPRCLGCQRYMRKDTTLPIHNTRCADRHFARAA